MSEEILQKLKEHDEQIDFIARKLVDHDEQFRLIREDMETRMATKDDIRSIVTTLDELLGLAKKKDQELAFMGERVGCVEKDVTRMKPLVGLV